MLPPSCHEPDPLPLAIIEIAIKRSARLPALQPQGSQPEVEVVVLRSLRRERVDLACVDVGRGTRSVAGGGVFVSGHDLAVPAELLGGPVEEGD